MKTEIFLKYIYKAEILDENLGEKNEEMINFFEIEILNVIKFDITNIGLRYDYFESILNYIFKKYNIEFKNISTLDKIKNYFLAQIRHSFIFPCILKFDTRTITLACINILLKQLFPKKNFLISELSELTNIKDEIIKCQNLFEVYLFEHGNNNNNSININNTNNYTIQGINFETIRTINTNNG